MIPWQLPQSGNLEQQLWQGEQRLGLGELFSLGLSHSFERETTVGLAREELRIAEAEEEAGTFDPHYARLTDHSAELGFEVRHSHAMSEEDYKASEWFRKKDDGKSAIDYTPNMTPQRARILAEVYDRRRHEEQLLSQSAEGSFGRQALLFGASFLAQLPDPVNFIPLGGGMARGGGLAAKIGRGALEGAAGTALADAVIFPTANARGEDFGFFDAALDITFGAALGGGLAGIGGKISQWREGRTAAEFDRLGRDLSAALEDAGLGADEAVRAARRVQETLRGVSDGLDEARRLRQSLAGPDRLAAGRAMEKALLDVAGDEAADVRLWHEQLAAGRAFDQVAGEIEAGRAPDLPADEVLFAVRPEDLEGLLVQRGPSIMGSDGEIRVTGRRLKREKGSSSGYGLVKIEVSHPEITRADVMRLPRIVRDYEPSALGADGRREWRVPAEDGSGQHVLVAEGRTPDGRGTLVSFYRYTPGEGGPGLSKRRTPVESRQAGFRPEPGDTGGGLPYRPSRSQQGQNAPERSGKTNIDAPEGNVKDGSPARALPEYRAPDVSRGLDAELKAMEIDPATGRSLDEDEALRLAEDGRAAPEELAELERAALEHERVTAREEIALSLVPCIIGGS